MFVCSLVLTLLLGTIVPAAAGTPVWYGVVGQSRNTDGTKTVGYGTKANVWIYTKQSPQDGDWVNSLYAGTAAGSFYEAGWIWFPGSVAQPVAFTHFYDSRIGYHYPDRWLAATLTPGTRVTFEISNMGGGDTWYTYISGVRKDVWTSTGIKSSYPCVGSERYNTADYSKGSFTYAQYLKKLTTGYGWNYWPGAMTNNDTDPVSNFYANYVSRSDHYVYVDDHQN